MSDKKSENSKSPKTVDERTSLPEDMRSMNKSDRNYNYNPKKDAKDSYTHRMIC